MLAIRQSVHDGTYNKNRIIDLKHRILQYGKEVDFNEENIVKKNVIQKKLLLDCKLQRPKLIFAEILTLAPVFCACFVKRLYKKVSFLKGNHLNGKFAVN